MTCLTWEQVVDYVANDGDASVEEHLMSCSSCTAEAESAMRIARAIRGALPPVVSAVEVDTLRARGLVIHDNVFVPGTRTEVRFEHGVDLLIHHLAGLDLARAERVDVTVRIESTGDVLADDHFAPFDAARGEILIACQRHFAGLPPDIQFDVRVHTPGAEPVLATYLIPHVIV